MCYYATTDYTCGDWRWGNMKERCPRQHRIGETCGAKLVHHESVTKSDEACPICKQIKVKRGRLQKEQDNIDRWKREGNKFSASIEKAERESAILQEAISELWSKRPSVIHSKGAARGTSETHASTRHAPPGHVAATGGAYPYSPNGQAQASYSYATTGQSSRHAPTYANGNGSGHPSRHASGYAPAPAPASSNRHSVYN